MKNKQHRHEVAEKTKFSQSQDAVSHLLLANAGLWSFEMREPKCVERHDCVDCLQMGEPYFYMVRVMSMSASGQ